MPEAPKFVEGWTLGEPDLIVKMPKAYTVKAEGRDEFCQRRYQPVLKHGP